MKGKVDGRRGRGRLERKGEEEEEEEAVEEEGERD